jgi:hypothetical protein
VEVIKSSMIKEELAEKYCQEWDQKFGWMKSDCVYDNILFDLNEVIREELIKFLAWYGTCEIDVTKRVVDNYLKSQQT